MLIDKSSASTAPAAGGSHDNASPPPYEAAILTDTVHHLHRSPTAYHTAEEAGREPTSNEVQNVAAAMRDVGNHHPDPKAKSEWHKRAEKFMRATKPMRQGILREAGGIIRVTLAIPYVLLGTALHVTGGAIHAAESVLGGLGDVVTGNSRTTEGTTRSRLGSGSPLGHVHAYAGFGSAARSGGCREEDLNGRSKAEDQGRRR